MLPDRLKQSLGREVFVAQEDRAGVLRAVAGVKVFQRRIHLKLLLLRRSGKVKLTRKDFERITRRVCLFMEGQIVLMAEILLAARQFLRLKWRMIRQA